MHRAEYFFPLTIVLALTAGGVSLAANGQESAKSPFTKTRVERTERTGIRDLVTTYFSGEAVVSGTYQQLKQDPMGHQSTQLCFHPTPESSKLLPEEGPKKFKRFCFSNQDEAIQKLQIPEQVLADSAICTYGGKATIQISDYRIYSTLSGADSAKLDKVLSVTAPKWTTCEEFLKKLP